MTVQCTHDLHDALKSSGSGEVIQLEPGEYENLVLKNVQYPAGAGGGGGVTVRGGPGVVIHGLTTYDCLNIRFEEVEFVPGAGNCGGWGIVVLNTSQGLHFNHVLIHGDPLVSGDGGIRFITCAQCSVTDSELTEVYQACRLQTSDTVEVARNHFHHFRSDANNCSGGRNYSYQDNLIHDAMIVEGDHSDAIQVFRGSGGPNVVGFKADHNVIFQGQGAPSQGIFLRNENGQADPHQNFSVTNNFIFEAGMGNGIYASGIAGLTITGNMVWGPEINGSFPRLLIADADGPCTSVVCEGNICQRIDPTGKNSLVPIPPLAGAWQLFMTLTNLAQSSAGVTRC